MSSAPRQRSELVGTLRRLRTSAAAGARAPAAAPRERCELCRTTIPEEHRHLLHLVERRILCVCAACWSMRSGDAELRPVGARTAWLEDLEMPEDVWARFSIPIGLAFFMRSTQADSVIAMYPSPAGATESELDLAAWGDLVALNPALDDMEPDAEGLIVNRLAEPHAYVIAPIDRCYALVGTVKASWEGISGGPGMEEAVSAFFADLRPGTGR
jgi:hypothetical protein